MLFTARITTAIGFTNVYETQNLATLLSVLECCLPFMVLEVTITVTKGGDMYDDNPDAGRIGVDEHTVSPACI